MFGRDKGAAAAVNGARRRENNMPMDAVEIVVNMTGLSWCYHPEEGYKILCRITTTSDTITFYDIDTTPYQSHYIITPNHITFSSFPNLNSQNTPIPSRPVREM